MDRPRVQQVPEGSGEQGKWRKLVAKSSVVPQRPSRLRELMMMMMNRGRVRPVFKYGFSSFSLIVLSACSTPRHRQCLPSLPHRPILRMNSVSIHRTLLWMNSISLCLWNTPVVGNCFCLWNTPVDGYFLCLRNSPVDGYCLSLSTEHSCG